jgi:hypothetical protein
VHADAGVEHGGPQGSVVPTPHSSPRAEAPGRGTVGAIRRIAEEEHIVIVLLAGFALIFLLVFPPALFVNDSWLNLVAGREVVEHGLPSHDTLTVYGAGRVWTDQQWLAQVLMYGAHGLGGYALLSILTCASVVGAFTIAAVAARTLGAGPRAIWVLFLPVLVAAPWAWSIRAQMLTLPLYTGLLWLLATEARRPTGRIWLALPMLVLWGNLHGSAALGALLVLVLVVYELGRSRGRSWRRSVPLGLLAPLMLLVTPYGPGATVRYYHLLLVDPPFKGQVTEWRWPAPATNTIAFYVLICLTIPIVAWGRKRLTIYDFAVLAVTLAGAFTAIRGVPWFAMACMLLVPVAIGRSLEARHRGEPRRGLNLGIGIALGSAILVAAGSLFLRSDSWFMEYWPNAPADAVASVLRPGDRVFAPDRFSDWLLWRIPELRGRTAYDVRFELYDREFFNRLARYNGETGSTWKSFADGYRIVLVDETVRSHTKDFLAEPGARVVYRGKELTVVERPAVGR